MADGPTKFYLQWNAVNWITVVMMVFIAMLVFGALASGARQFARARESAAADA
jgi:hypothetical protein